MLEYFFQCPYCWEQISMLIDTSISEQSYIEDCEVCCRPINIHVNSRNLEIQSFQVEAIQ